MKKFNLILVFMFLISTFIALGADENKTAQIYYNATHLIYGDRVNNITQDNSTRENFGYVQGTPILTTTTKMVGEGSLETDGTASIEFVAYPINVSNGTGASNSSLYNLTVSGWFNFTNVDNGFLVFAAAAADSAGFFMRWRTTPALNLIVSDGINEIAISATTSLPIINKWSHLCFSINQTMVGTTRGTSVFLYVNGTQVGTGKNAIANTPIRDFSLGVDKGNISLLGRYDNAVFTVDGNVDEFVLINRSFGDGADYCKHLYDLGTNGTRIEKTAPVPPDATPPEITLINMTSEAGVTSIGQIIYNSSSESLTKLNSSAKTNDTTPTFFSLTDEASTCGLYMTSRTGVVVNSSFIVYASFDNHNDSNIANNFEDGFYHYNLSADSSSLEVNRIFNGNDKFRKYFDAYNNNATDTGYIVSNGSIAGQNVSLPALRNRPPQLMIGAKFSINSNSTRLDDSSLVGFRDGGNDVSRFKLDYDGLTNNTRCVGRNVTATSDLTSMVTFILSSGQQQRNHTYGAVCLYDGTLLNNNIQLWIYDYNTGLFNKSANQTIAGQNSFVHINSTTSFRIGDFDLGGVQNWNGTIDEVFVVNESWDNLTILSALRDGIIPNYNYSRMIEKNGTRGCSTTGSLTHTCTAVDTDSLNIGLASGLISCQNGISLENRTSTSGLFYVNITDSIAPNSTQLYPPNGTFFTIGINDTNINFTFSATDNIDFNFTARLYIDNALQITNTTYFNGTNASYRLSPTLTLGTHNWSVNFTDSYNNINGSATRVFSIQSQPSLGLFLDGLNDTRSYEFGSSPNITANCSQSSGSCQVEIDILSFDKLNVSSGNDKTEFTFNITKLRIVNFTNSSGRPGISSYVLATSGILNITSDNRTVMANVSINISNTGNLVTSNLNISYYGKVKRLKGDIETRFLKDNRFIYAGSDYIALNTTFTSSGSVFIYYNFTDIDKPINMTFFLTGFDLDSNNQFNHREQFNSTATSIGSMNETLSFGVNSSMGIFDDFKINKSIWSITSTAGSCILEYSGSGRLYFDDPENGACTISYSDLAADLRNTSRVQILAYTVARVDISATDGTSTIEIYDHNSNVVAGYNNITFRMVGTTVVATSNVSSDLTTDISSLNFDNPIKIIFQTDDQDGLEAYLDEIQWSGAWLGYHKENGTYRNSGNFTSRVVNWTQNNVSKATLTANLYNTGNTSVISYLSNTCNATNPTFTSVTLGITHTFPTTGNAVCARFSLNSTSNLTSPVVRTYTVNIVKTSLENITVDLNNDGLNEVTITGRLNSTTSPYIVNLTPVRSQLNTIKIATKTAGLLQIDRFRVNSSASPIVLDNATFENCFNCSINFTFSGDSLTVNDLQFDFFGSWNYTVVAKGAGLRIEKLIQVFYSNFNLSHPRYYPYYDVFPKSKNQTNVTPYLQSDLAPIWNITNLAYDRNINIYVKTNETMNACINVTYSNNSNRSYTPALNFILNTSYQNISRNITLLRTLNFTQANETINISMFLLSANSSPLNHTIMENQEFVINISSPYANLTRNVDYRINYSTGNFTLLNLSFNATGIFISYNHTKKTESWEGSWNWWDLNNCNSSRFLIPWAYFSASCVDCYVKESYLDNFNIIRE